MSGFFEKKTALVTGASSGIGFELAKRLMAEGANLILTARDLGKLNEASGSLEKQFGRKPFLVSKDLGEPGAALELFQELKSKNSSVDILVNNAGFGAGGLFHKTDRSKSLGMIDVNVRALTELTHLFLPAMVQQKSGWVLNVASTAAFQPIPTEAVYAAGKAYVLLFSEALHEELKALGVTVTCLCPGPTDTPFFGKDILASRKLKRVMMTPAKVAQTGLEALKKKRALVTAGFQNKAARFAVRFAPRSLVAKMARKMVETHA